MKFPSCFSATRFYNTSIFLICNILLRNTISALTINHGRDRTTEVTILNNNFTERNYRPILHSHENKSDENAVSIVNRILEVDELEKAGRAGCPVCPTGGCLINQVTSTIPIIVFIVAAIIGGFWFFVFVVLFEKFVSSQSHSTGGYGYGYERSIRSTALGSLIENNLNGFVGSDEFNRVSRQILNSISKAF